MLDMDARLSTPQAATVARVDPALIRQWAHRGQLTPVARTRGGRPLYRLGDVLDTEKRMRARLLAS